MATFRWSGRRLAEVLKTYPKLDRARLIHETVRRVISGMVADLLAETRTASAKYKPRFGRCGAGAGRRRSSSFSPQMRENNRVLQAFLSTAHVPP